MMMMLASGGFIVCCFVFLLAVMAGVGGTHDDDVGFGWLYYVLLCLLVGSHGWCLWYTL